jgi:hypothetical protein
MPFSTLGFSTPPAALLGLVAGSLVGTAAYRVMLRRPFAERTDSPAPAIDANGIAANLAVEPQATPSRSMPRRNAGRLLLPASAARLTEDDESSLRRVNPFIDRLAELRVSDWVAIGRTVIEGRSAIAARSAAWVTVDATIAHWRLGVVAWHVRDAIETAAFLACHSGPVLSRSDRQMFFAAQGAAEDAALALLVHGYIPEQDVESLCAPFAAFASLDPVVGM